MADTDKTPAPEEKQPSAAENTLTLEFWDKRWVDGNSQWQENDGCELLWQNIDSIMQKFFPTKKAEDLKVFIPLCGKAKDIYLFYKMGFTVVGIEFAPLPIKEFFDENEIAEVSTAKKPFTKSPDGRLILGEGDLFSFQAEGKLPFPKYDIVWDRGSFVAINENDRERYAAFMKSLAGEGGIQIINIVEYDRAEYGGPPLASNQEELQNYYGADATIELLGRTDRLGEDQEDRQVWIDQGLTRMTEALFTIK